MVKTQTFEYFAGEEKFIGYLASDDTQQGKRPGVLVVHEAWGLGDHSRRRAERLAELGYVALAVDMFGNGKVAQDTGEGMQLITDLRNDLPTLHKRIRAAFDALATHPETDPSRIASIGFCFGGTTSLELARSGAPVKGVVSFHGGLETKSPAEAGKVTAKVLALTGHDDPFIPPAQVIAFMEEMTKAAVDFQVVFYGGTVHSFTEPRAGERGIPALKYNALSDARSWTAMKSFFDEIFAVEA